MPCPPSNSTSTYSNSEAGLDQLGSKKEAVAWSQGELQAGLQMLPCPPPTLDLPANPPEEKKVGTFHWPGK